jgi:hypothetical protein
MLGHGNSRCVQRNNRRKKARAFYEGMLELPFVSEDEFAIVYDLNGVSLRIQKVERVLTSALYCPCWSVSSIDMAVNGLMARVPSLSATHHFSKTERNLAIAVRRKGCLAEGSRRERHFPYRASTESGAR